MKQKEIRLILGDQLNIEHPWFSMVDDSVCYVMMEIKTETDYVRHHIQKVVGIFSAMRHFAEDLKSKGHQLVYFRINDENNQQDFLKNIESVNSTFNAHLVRYQLPDEYRLDQYFLNVSKQHHLGWIPEDTHHFLTQRGDLRAFFDGKKTYLMEFFYRNMRRRYRVLMDGEQPLGGLWNFDHDNRNKLPAKFQIETTEPKFFEISEVLKDVESANILTIGRIDPKAFSWTITSKSALELIDEFIEMALPNFGTYQDSLTEKHWFLFHSRLSFALNTKLIGPLELIRKVEEAHHQNPDRYPLNHIEGFIRQILGWREYMRGIYWAKMPDYENLNYFNHNAPLPDWYWTGDTKMNCLKKAITQSLDYGYAHHIQRLMVTGNFALLLGVHPDAVDQWYLGIYVDAFQWVEITNTRGMSQFADGGIVGSKPYVSSASYMHKMGDHCASCHYKKDLKTGSESCPFNAFYWDFYMRHRELLEKNPRIGMMYKVLDKMTPEKQIEIIETAEFNRLRINTL